MFEKDKLIFSLLLASKLAQFVGKITRQEYGLLISGP
jgi:hypothetical protein